MFFEYLTELCGFGVYDSIIIFDYKDIIKNDYLKMAESIYSYKVLLYDDIEKFRYLYETEIKIHKNKHIVILKHEIYLPYDIRMDFHCVNVDFKTLFPRLNTFVLENSYIFDLDLLYIAYRNLFETLSSEYETKMFLSTEIYGRNCVEEYRDYLIDRIGILADKNEYSSWQEAALLYGKLMYIRYRCDNCISGDKEFVHKTQERFKDFILNDYSKLSGYSAHKGPVLLSKGLDYIFMNSKKPALIVLDGMSILDWLIIEENLKGISYTCNSVFAIIPTITSISRQSLLSGKLPVQLETPFNLSKERKLFIDKCIENGFKEEEIKYHRGYEIDINYLDKCICIIINDIDELVHSQKQGDQGMYNDVRLLSRSGKVSKLIRHLYKNNFDVFITSDHGHVETETMGSPKGTGVELETKSKRTLILKDFADYEKTMEEFEMIEFPPFYLPKDYKYLLCGHDKSFGVKGDVSVSHGGISVEEVIVPFIKIQGVE